MTGIELLELNGWLASQLEGWRAWAAERSDATWLSLPTGNERFATCGELFRHAFTPLRRYSDQAAGREPADDSGIDPADWAALLTWANDCLEHHRQCSAALDPAAAEEVLEFKTRSAGVIHVSRRLALAHAATHCFWHLGGIAQLLRHGGTAPPQRSDLIFYAAAQFANHGA